MPLVRRESPLGRIAPPAERLHPVGPVSPAAHAQPPLQPQSRPDRVGGRARRCSDGNTRRLSAGSGPATPFGGRLAGRQSRGDGGAGAARSTGCRVAASGPRGGLYPRPRSTRADPPRWPDDPRFPTGQCDHGCVPMCDFCQYLFWLRWPAARRWQAWQSPFSGR